jgi:protein SCO1/2
MTFRSAALVRSIVAASMLVPAVSALADNERPAALRDVGLDQNLNQRVPLDLPFRDESGRAVRLGDYFAARPVILTLNYYACPMLCPLVLNDVLRTLRAMPLVPGKDFRVLTVSIDPHDTPAMAASKQAWYTARLAARDTADGWHFLTGNEDAIEALARAVGFRYQLDAKSGQYAHAAGIVVLTPDGRLARYFYGVEYSPRDVRLALVEASKGRIGSLADTILLFCFHYDPESGRYTIFMLNAVRAAGAATVLGLGGLMVVLFRREKSRVAPPDRKGGGTHAL